MKFSRVAQAMEKLEKTSKRTEMIAILSRLFEGSPAEEISYVCYYLPGEIAAGY